MNIEQTITETIERHVDAVEAPRIDLAAVRRVGRRRARVRTGLVAACLALLVGGGAYAVTVDRDGSHAEEIPPVDLPKMSFANGLQAWFNPDDNHVHMGGTEFDIGSVPSLDTSASTTPYGLVFFDEDQGVHLLRDDGSVRLLSEAPANPRSFYPTVKFDAEHPLAAWLTRGADGTGLTVYRFGADDGLVGEFPAPCDCEVMAMAGVDQGLVFVRGDGATWMLDPADGTDAAWQQVASAEVADVRNRVLLVEGQAPENTSLPGEWRFAKAEGPESLLTFDGAHELYWSSTLRSTTPGEPPLELDLPPGKGWEFVNMDSDGSVMVARATNSGQTWFDCDITTRECSEFDRSKIQSGDPGFIGNDM